MKRGEVSDSGLEDIRSNGYDRYDRQILLPEIGAQGQAALAAARVLVVGTGGLGSPIALYLAAAGVGTIGLVDYDTVGWSNLNRQILYRESDIGLSKVSVAAQRLRKLNSTINVVEHNGKLSSYLSVWRLVKEYDIVIDACDNFATRHLVGKVTEELDIPYVFGAIDGFCGQLSVFNYGEGVQRKKFRDLWPEEPLSEQTASTVSSAIAVASVGVTAGVVGNLQAGEAIKIICRFGDVLAGRLLSIDLRTLEVYKLSF